MNIYSTDWLASNPVFYHEKTGKVSHNINDVIDFSNIEFHPEGFNNYLSFGYSILSQSPVKYVKFLPPCTQLIAEPGTPFRFISQNDPVDQWLGKTSNEEQVIHQLQETVSTWESTTQGEIIIPTSGGYDSRLLNLMVRDKSRIRSFTYGISNNQAKSYEVVYAKRISETLGTRWNQIYLHEFNRYIPQWIDQFGVSTHAHGMYHIEFYKKIQSLVSLHSPLLSGIIGDAWAGSVKIPELNGVSDVGLLSYSHNLNADASMSNFKSEPILLSNYFNKNKEKLQLESYRVVEAMRFKIILLSYLLKVPQQLGFLPWSPFLIPDVALAMLMLPTERRKNRIWQKEFFAKHGLDLESMPLKISKSNTLDLQSMRHVQLQPLDETLLREVVNPSYVQWINTKIDGSLIDGLTTRLLGVKKIGGLMRRIGITDAKIKAYNAYITLKPIEDLLIRRNTA